MPSVSTITQVNFFRGYGIYTAGPYAERLLRLKDHQVLVVDDIYGRCGELLLEKNTVFDAVSLDRLRHKHLKQPFDVLVSIAEGVNSQHLEADVALLIEDSHFLSVLNERYSFDTLIRELLCDASRHSILLQKLTVMKVTEPELYIRTLFTSMLALLIAIEMRLPRIDRICVFWAGLYHDIGRLHLEPSVLGQAEPLSAAELLQLHAHVRISQTLMALEAVADSVIIDAVMDHQERCDGTGYPNGKLESEMSLLGQVLGLANSATAIYFKRMQTHGRGWHDVVGVLELTRQAYHFRSIEILRSLVSQSELPVTRVVVGDLSQDFILTVCAENKILRHWFDVLRQTLLGAGFVHGNRQLHALQNSVLHIATAYRFGLEECDTSMLGESIDGDILGKEQLFNDLHLLHQELLYHLRKLTQMLQRFCAEGSVSDLELQEQLDRCLARVLPFLK